MNAATLFATTTAEPRDADASPARAMPGWALLAAGVALTALTGNRWGVAALAWLAPVPFLLHLRRARGWRGHLALAAAVVLATSLQTMKIVSAPLPWFMGPIFGLPFALAMLAALWVAETARRRAGEVWGGLAFAAASALGAWVGTRWGLGAWSTWANSQVEAQPLMQLAALVGLAGIDFLMALVQASLAIALGAARPRRYSALFAAVAVSLAGALGWGALRLDTAQGRTVTVAAVVTDMGPSPAGLPSDAELARGTDELFARSALAAQRGARLVVWNEVATLVRPDGEDALIDRGARFAKQHGIDLVLAYGVLLERAPFRFDNKYAFLTSDGALAESYRKHHPVAVEPSIAGTEPLRALARPYATVAGAICYDYDFPAMARAHARLGAELVFLPSSDWRGIDPVHTEMARVRAIEGGFSLLRSVRWSASAGFDAYGRVRGWLPMTETNERVLVTALPVGRVRTLYALTGDAPVVGASSLLLAGALARGLRRRRPPAA